LIRCYCAVSSCVIIHIYIRTLVSIRTSLHFISIDLAATLPSIIDYGFCTKDNCTNDTLSGYIRSDAKTSPEEAGDEEVERSCDTLFMCIVTTLNKGLRNGGGIGDVLRQPSSQVSHMSIINSSHSAVIPYSYTALSLFVYTLGTALLLPCYL
jgi:hypothetical protein